MTTLAGIVDEKHFSLAEELITHLAPTSGEWTFDPRDWIFRGQANADWGLVPKLLRNRNWERYLRNPIGGTAADVVRAETRFIRDFFNAIDHAGLSIPEDRQAFRRVGGPFQLITDPYPPDELLSLFALAQHYGIPTRLIDWSRSSRTGAYFAAADVAKAGPTKPRGYGDTLAIWAMRESFMYEAFPTVVIPAPARELDIRIVTAPYATNPNLAAQRGLFTLDRKNFSDTGFEHVVAAAVGGSAPGRLRPHHLPVFRKMTLPHAEAPKLLRLLAMEGVHAGALFPGYAGVVESLEERMRWDHVPVAWPT